MKTSVSTAFKNHLASNYHTLATCWKVTRQDSTVKAFTDHDADIVFDSVTYLAASGYTASNIDSTDALNVDNLEVQGMLTSPSITEDELRAGLWDYASVEIFLVNWADLSMGRLVQRVGTLGEISTNRGYFVAELRGLTQAFTRMIGELTSPACRASLGDERCKVNLVGGSPSFTRTGTITAVRDDNMTIFDTSRIEDGPLEESTFFGLQPMGGTEGARFVTDDDLPNLVNGGAVAIYGMTGGNAHLNGVYIAREVVHSGASVSFAVPEIDAPFGFQSSPAGKAVQLGNSSGYFDFGVLTWTSGLNNGLSMEVKNYVPTLFMLALPMPFEIQVGDTYSVHAGCDKKLETCRDRFDNIVNMRAEPYLPGMDKVVQVARRQ